MKDRHTVDSPVGVDDSKNEDSDDDRVNEHARDPNSHPQVGRWRLDVRCHHRGYLEAFRLIGRVCFM